jgi:transposase
MQGTSKGEGEIVRGREKNCQDCLKRFSLVAREHQCKRCLKAVCSDCGNNRREVYTPSFTLRDSRVCRACK